MSGKSELIRRLGMSQKNKLVCSEQAQEGRDESYWKRGLPDIVTGDFDCMSMIEYA